MRRNLSRQFAQRALVIILMVGVLFAALAWGIWEYQNRAEEKQHGQLQQAAMREQLDLLFQSWQNDAETLAAGITFQRMLEAPGAVRWQKLRAYMSSLAETYPYSGLVVVDAHQHIVFAIGEETGEFPPGAPAPRLADWYHSKDHRQLHRLMRAPLWLGLDGGHGELWLLRPLDNLTLRRLAPAGAAAHLTVDDIVYASSLGNNLVGRQTHYPRTALHTSEAGNLCADVPLANAAERLHIELSRNTAPAWKFALSGLVLSLALLAALYFALGRWLGRTLERVRALGRTAEAFGASHRVDTQVEAALEPSGGGQEDELDALRLALRELMQGAEARDVESRAYLQTLDLLEEAVVEVDRDGRILRASPALAMLAGGEAPQRLVECFHADDREALELEFANLFSGAKSMTSLRLRISHPTHGEGWIECRFVPADQPVTRVRGVLRDITQDYLHERQVAHMALHDALTGLPNRTLLEDRCKVAIRLAQRQPGHKVGVGFIDLDHFKQINDSYGHKTGDQLLKAFAGRLRQSLREGDTLARWGGDEFVALLPNLHDLDALREVAGKISSGCREPLDVDGTEYAVTFSMGFAVWPDDADNVDTLLSQADHAMFYAKAQGRNNVQFFIDMGRKGLGKKELYIQSKLAAAIRGGRIQTFFQPIVEAGSRRIVAFEALARWNDDELGWVPASSFMHMAENLGLVRDLGDQVWEAALARMAHHRQRGLRMSVNLSTRQLFMPGLGAKLLDDVTRHGLAPDDFILEVTESVALREVDYAAERLKALADAGFRIALDDFGTGYSSLSQLHDMPVDELKIDIAFVQRIHEPVGREIIEAIFHIAHAHNLVTVAEGVEDEATAAALEQIGVRQMQGYLFAQPMSASEMDALLDG
jgi:diguanylate cyclase (GGDEF)-like protein